MQCSMFSQALSVLLAQGPNASRSVKKRSGPDRPCQSWPKTLYKQLRDIKSLIWPLRKLSVRHPGPEEMGGMGAGWNSELPIGCVQ